MTTTLLVPPERLVEETVRIDGDAYHHLFRVRRLAAGETLRLVDGAGVARWARIVRVGRGSAEAVPEGAAPGNEVGFEVELFVAAPRPGRLTWLVEKATEVGATAVRLAQWRRAGRSPGAGAIDRLRRVARAAMEQCHRSRLPVISGPHPVDEVAERLASFAERWLLHRGPGARPGRSVGRATAVLVGPEGGWEEEEVERWLEAGCLPIRLGPATLRLETAAVLGAALAAGAGSEPVAGGRESGGRVPPLR